jgi:hypothetical protein
LVVTRDVQIKEAYHTLARIPLLKILIRAVGMAQVSEFLPSKHRL